MPATCVTHLSSAPVLPPSPTPLPLYGTLQLCLSWPSVDSHLYVHIKTASFASCETPPFSTPAPTSFSSRFLLYFLSLLHQLFHNIFDCLHIFGLCSLPSSLSYLKSSDHLLPLPQPKFFMISSHTNLLLCTHLYLTYLQSHMYIFTSDRPSYRMLDWMFIIFSSSHKICKSKNLLIAIQFWLFGKGVSFFNCKILATSFAKHKQ